MAQRQTAKRRAELADMILLEGNYRIKELADHFHVSRETIRKDLLALEEEGVGQRGRNRFIVAQDSRELSIDVRNTEHMEEKQRIACRAVQLVQPGATVFLDSGTTTYEIAKLLAHREGLTVITNSVVIPSLFAKTNNTLVSLGGEMRSLSLACVGMVTLNALRLFRADVAFIGTSGFFHRDGPCSASYSEAEIKRVMIENAREAILVCDSSKLTADCAVQFCTWADLRCVITDGGASQEQLSALRSCVDVVIAD